MIKTGFPAVGKARKAIRLPTQDSKVRIFDSCEFRADRNLISASTLRRPGRETKGDTGERGGGGGGDGESTLLTLVAAPDPTTL